MDRRCIGESRDMGNCKIVNQAKLIAEYDIIYPVQFQLYLPCKSHFEILILTWHTDAIPNREKDIEYYFYFSTVALVP